MIKGINKNRLCYGVLLYSAATSFASQKPNLSHVLDKLLYRPPREMQDFETTQKKADNAIVCAKTSECFVVHAREKINAICELIHEISKEEQYRRFPGKREFLSGFEINYQKPSLSIERSLVNNFLATADSDHVRYDSQLVSSYGKDAESNGELSLRSVSSSSATALLFQLNPIITKQCAVGSQEFNNLLAIAKRHVACSSNKEVEHVAGFVLHYAHSLLINEELKELSNKIMVIDSLYSTRPNCPGKSIFSDICRGLNALNQGLDSARGRSGYFADERLLRAVDKLKVLFDQLGSTGSEYRSFSQQCARHAIDLAGESKKDILARLSAMRQQQGSVSKEFQAFVRANLEEASKIEKEAQDFLVRSESMMWEMQHARRSLDDLVREIDPEYKEPKTKRRGKGTGAVPCLQETEGDFVVINSSSDGSDSEPELSDSTTSPASGNQPQHKQGFCLAVDGWEKKRGKGIQLPYHPRVYDWFCNEEKREAATIQEREYHSFPLWVDSFLVAEGRKSIRTNCTTGLLDTVHQMAGEIVLPNGSRRSVVFSITTNTDGLCYHRGIIPFASADDVLRQFSDKSRVIIDEAVSRSESEAFCRSSGDAQRESDARAAKRMRKTGKIKVEDDLHVVGSDALNGIDIVLYRHKIHTK